MKTSFRLLIFLLAIFVFALAGLNSKPSAVKADGDNPCDPTPSLIRICMLRGGTFNFSTCQCDLP
jgi:hypothetical protein